MGNAYTNRRERCGRNDGNILASTTILFRESKERPKP
jgi:hypothetical protein